MLIFLTPVSKKSETVYRLQISSDSSKVFPHQHQGRGTYSQGPSSIMHPQVSLAPAFFFICPRSAPTSPPTCYQGIHPVRTLPLHAPTRLVLPPRRPHRSDDSLVPFVNFMLDNPKAFSFSHALLLRYHVSLSLRSRALLP